MFRTTRPTGTLAAAHSRHGRWFIRPHLDAVRVADLPWRSTQIGHQAIVLSALVFTSQVLSTERHNYGTGFPVGAILVIAPPGLSIAFFLPCTLRVPSPLVGEG